MLPQCGNMLTISGISYLKLGLHIIIIIIYVDLEPPRDGGRDDPG